MIRVTVELIPGGIGRPRLLGIAEISKDPVESETNTTDGKLGSYTITLSKWAPKQGELWKRGRVEGFDRKRRGAWDLLFLGLRDCVGGRNKETKSNTERKMT